MDKQEHAVGLALKTWCSAAALSIMAVAANAQESLIFNVYFPKQAPLYTQVLAPWIDTVEEASGGTLQIEVPEASVGGGREQFPNVVDDVVNISIAPVGLFPPKMRLPNIGQSPFNAATSEAASVATWRTWEEYLNEDKAWGQFKLLATIALSDTTIQTTGEDPITSIEDFAGKKINTSPGTQAVLVDALGATAVPSDGPTRREQLSGGISDGQLMTPDATFVLGFGSLIKTLVKVENGMSRTLFLLFMKQSTFDQLPPEAQAALDAHSGEALSQTGGALQDRMSAGMLKNLTEKNGVKVMTASPELSAEIADRVGFINSDWVAAADAAGFDGAKILEFYRASAAEAGGS